MKKLIATFALLFLVITLAGAQSTVHGRVTNSTDGKPVANATIKAVGGTATVTTNSGGNYNIDLPAGITQLSCTAAGMKPQVKTIKTVEMNFILEPKAAKVINKADKTETAPTNPSN